MDKRAPNLTAADLVEKYSTIIENKQTDVCSNKQKELAWKNMAVEFNAASQTCHTFQQLKQVWLAYAVLFFIQSGIYKIYFTLHNAKVKTEFIAFLIKNRFINVQTTNSLERQHDELAQFQLPQYCQIPECTWLH